MGVAWKVGGPSPIDWMGRPFWDRRLDYLDCSCCFTILLHVLSGYYYSNEGFRDSDAAVQLDHALVAFTLLTVAIIIGLIMAQALELHFKTRASASVSCAVAASIVALRSRLCRDGNGSALMGFVDQLNAVEHLQCGARVVHPKHGSGRVKDVITLKDGRGAGSEGVLVHFMSGDQRYFDKNSAKKLSIVPHDGSAADMVRLEAFRSAVVALCVSEDMESASEEAAAVAQTRANTEACSHLAEAIYLILKVVAGDSDLSAACDKGVPKALVSTPSVAPLLLCSPEPQRVTPTREASVCSPAARRTRL